MIPPPDDRLIERLLIKHGLPSTGPLSKSTLEGVANHTFFLPEIVLKFCKEPDFLSDTYTEVIAGPAVHASGAKTPRLLCFDDDRDGYPLPITIWERASGEALGNLHSVPDHCQIYCEAAEQAGVWHAAIQNLKDPNGWLDRPEGADADTTLNKNADRLPRPLRRWCELQLEWLDTADPGIPSFVHWDLHAHNIVVDKGLLTGIIDWGDAGFGDPVLNFHCFPAEFLPSAMAAFGYSDHDFVGRLLKEVLCYALNAFGVDDWPTLRHTGMKRWRSLEKLYEMDVPASWRHWLSDAPPVTS